VRSAKARAARLIRLVEAAIESGEFTPHFSYLLEDVRLGPCGCAHAAAQFVAGVPLDGVGREHWRDVPGLSAVEARALEYGYEGDVDPGAHDFYAAGKELRKFHPGRTS
jgi:hypothetical protein